MEFVSIEEQVPKDHLLRKIDKVILVKMKMTLHAAA